ncbi:MAG: anti-sigma F factor [Bacilli bacterium]
MYNELKTSFLASTDNVLLARTISVGFLIELNLPVNLLNEIKTIVSEAVTNAIVHGYSNDSTKYVDMNLRYDEESIYIEVIDYGIGIEDIEKAKEPLFSTKIDEERAGLGFTIMEVFTDSLQVISKLNEGTKVIMVKKYHEQGEY